MKEQAVLKANSKLLVGFILLDSNAPCTWEDLQAETKPATKLTSAYLREQQVKTIEKPLELYSKHTVEMKCSSIRLPYETLDRWEAYGRSEWQREHHRSYRLSQEPQLCIGLRPHRQVQSPRLKTISQSQFHHYKIKNYRRKDRCRIPWSATLTACSYSDRLIWILREVKRSSIAWDGMVQSPFVLL